MTERNSSRIDAFIKGLEAQEKLYEKLRDVMHREMDSLASENQNSMISLFKEKLVIMKQLEEEDTEIADIKSNWKDIIDKGSPEHDKVQSLLKEMENMLKDILEMEEKTRQFFESFKSEYENATSKSKAIRANQAYKSQGNT